MTEDTSGCAIENLKSHITMIDSEIKLRSVYCYLLINYFSHSCSAVFYGIVVSSLKTENLLHSFAFFSPSSS